MAKGGKPQTTTTTLDPAAMGFRNEAYAMARRVAGQPWQAYDGQRVAGIAPQEQQASDNYLGYANAGRAGLDQAADAVRNPADVSAFMNPYTQNVVNPLRAQFANTRALGLNAIGDQAAQARAFGGARQGIAEGQFLADTANNENAQIANLYNTGYNQAAGRADAFQGLQAQTGMGVAGLGLTGNGGLAGLGGTFRGINQAGMDTRYNDFVQRRDWGLRNLDILNRTMGNPTGQTSTTPTTRNVGAGILGGASTGAGIGGIFGPVGAGIGAGIGGLLGLF